MSSFNSVLRDRVRCAAVRATLCVIACEREEGRHLDFQAEWFARAIARTPRLARPVQATSSALRFGRVLSAAVVLLRVDHQRWVMAGLGVRPLGYLRGCLRTLAERRRFCSANVPFHRFAPRPAMGVAPVEHAAQRGP